MYNNCSSHLSERPDAEVSALDLLLNHELWSDAISLTAESCKQVCGNVLNTTTLCCYVSLYRTIPDYII